MVVEEAGVEDTRGEAPTGVCLELMLELMLDILDMLGAGPVREYRGSGMHLRLLFILLDMELMFVPPSRLGSWSARDVCRGENNHHHHRIDAIAPFLIVKFANLNDDTDDLFRNRLLDRGIMNDPTMATRSDGDFLSALSRWRRNKNEPVNEKPNTQSSKSHTNKRQYPT